MAKTLIIADDSAMARMVIQRCFEIAGLHDASFLECKDGAEALKAAKTENVDLVVSDLNMPEMDGRGLLKALKADDTTSSIPVIVITSSKNEALESEFLELGAKAILGKPISPAVILEELQKLPGWLE